MLCHVPKHQGGGVCYNRQRRSSYTVVSPQQVVAGLSGRSLYCAPIFYSDFYTYPIQQTTVLYTRCRCQNCSTMNFCAQLDNRRPICTSQRGLALTQPPGRVPQSGLSNFQNSSSVLLGGISERCLRGPGLGQIKPHLRKVRSQLADRIFVCSGSHNNNDGSPGQSS